MAFVNAELKAFSEGLQQLVSLVATAEGALRVSVDGMAPGTATEETLAEVRDRVLELSDRIPELTLVSRMFSKQPAPGYGFWIDAGDPSHIYMLEAPLAAAEDDVGFRGIRIPKPAGDVVGKIETNMGPSLSWLNRATDTGWS